MPTQTITPPAERKIGKEIYNAIFNKSLDFRIELPYLDAADFLAQIGKYNNFQSATVLAALERVDRLIPRASYGAGNPNNGQRTYSIKVGREGSPVIYIHRYEFTFGKVRLDGHTMKAICREMERSALADESDYIIEEDRGLGARKIEFRFWWD